MRYLADSDVLIDALNGQDGVIDLLDERSREGFAISIISVGELYDGAVGAANFQQRLEDTDALLSRYPIVTLNRVTMLQFAQLRVDLPRLSGFIAEPGGTVEFIPGETEYQDVYVRAEHGQRRPGRANVGHGGRARSAIQRPGPSSSAR